MNRPTAFFLAGLIGVAVAVGVPIGWIVLQELSMWHLGALLGAFVGGLMYPVLRNWPDA